MEHRLSFVAACKQYTHRFTMQHCPEWARHARPDNSYYAPQYRTDREWYENTYFPGENGIPLRDSYCYSVAPTWPLGQALDAPVQGKDLTTS